MASRKLSLEELQKKAKKIKLVALDMDGTLTDGSINIGGRENCSNGSTPKTDWALPLPGGMVCV